MNSATQTMLRDPLNQQKTSPTLLYISPNFNLHFTHLNYSPVYLNRVFRVYRATSFHQIPIHVEELASFDVTMSRLVVVVSEISFVQMTLVLNVDGQDVDDAGD